MRRGEPGAQLAHQRRWFVACSGRADLPAEEVMVGYGSESSRVVVGTGHRGFYAADLQPEGYSLRMDAMLRLIELTRSSPRFESPPGPETFAIIKQYAAETHLWKPAVATIDSTSTACSVARWQAGWALVAEYDDVCIWMVGMAPVPSRIDLRKVAGWREYDLDLGRFQSLAAQKAVPLPFSSGRGLA